MAPHFHHHDHGGPPRAAHVGPSLPMPSETSSELRFLDPPRLAFRREDGRFEVRLDGSWVECTPVRLFPLTEPEGWVSLVDTDGRELGVLLEPKGLRRADLTCLREELRRRYLVPKIERILACRRRGEAVEWVVTTDRGELTFRTRHLRDQIRDASPKRLSLIDVEGNRYHIPDVRALDRDSRRRLDAHL